jgi:hypothetical protein
MKPSEKAIELIEKYKGLVYPYIGSSMLTNDPNDAVILTNAKICVGILIDEMLRVAETADKNTNGVIKAMYPNREWSQVDYWTEVKKEVEKL